MSETFRDVPVFVAVVESGGFSIAARRLNLSRSAVGKAIARVERRVGARLFHRTTRKQSLTDDGQAYFESCQRALAELRAGEAMMESGRKTVAGKLRVSVPVLFGRLRVAPVLTRLAAKHAGLDLELSFSDRLVDLVEDGFDFAVRNGPLDPATRLVARRLTHERMVVCASPQYLGRHGRPMVADDLPNHRAIAYCRGGKLHRWRFPDGGVPVEVAMPPTRLRFDDIGAMADAAADGLGIAWLPHWLVLDRLASGELVDVLPDVRPLVADIHAVWPSAPHLPLRVRIALDALTVELPTAEAVDG